MAEDNKLFAVIAYFFGLLGALVAYFMKKDDPFVKFHAIQSILLNIAVVGVYIVLGIVGFIGVAIDMLINIGFPIIGTLTGLVSLVFALAVLIAWILCLWKSFNGERYKLPVIGNMAEKYAG